ncbi:MAG: riboflavin synthase [Leptospirillia bacterium]
MFTGIVEEMGTVTGTRRIRGGVALSISCNTVLEGTEVGGSIMVNGACLTATTLSADGFTADVSPETCRVTTVGNLKPGDKVNLERSMALGGRLGGHLVTGHVDAVGTVRAVTASGDSTELRFNAPEKVLALCVPKGSIAIEGVSLTVNSVDDSGFSVMIIPHTASHTTLLALGVGGQVNLEADLIGKYVARLLEGYGGKASGGGLTLEDLARL